jgi:S-adenosylmethionine uptake transporter
MHSPAPARAVAGHLTAILLFSTGVFFFAVNDALGKWLVADYTVGQLLLVRSIGAGLILVPAMLAARVDVLRLRDWPLQLARVAFMALDTYCFYFATRFMPLADVMTYYMAAPLIITALSVPLLGEKVGVQRWGAVLFGFAGVVVALQPSGASFTPAAFIALAGAVMYALAVTVTRRLRDTHWLQLVGWQFAGAGLLGAVTAPAGWVTPGALDLFLMVLVGITAMVCFICITRALARAPASLLAPFHYTSIVWAVILGYLVFGDRPTVPILIGNAMIVASGLFVLYREQVRGRSVADTTEPIP